MSAPDVPGAGRLKPQYPTYLSDPDGLDRFCRQVRQERGHDMANVNNNSLGRLLDTIEALRTALTAMEQRATDAERRESEARAAGLLKGLRLAREAVRTCLGDPQDGGTMLDALHAIDCKIDEQTYGEPHD